MRLVQRGSVRAALALVLVAFSTVSIAFSLNSESSAEPNSAASAIVNAALAFPFIPDPNMTQGSVCSPGDPDYERLRYGEQIPYCRRNVSREERSSIYDAYGVSSRCRKEYTIDHFIPLSLGGSNHRDNLWPEAKSIKALRQDLELALYKKISKGEISQAQAIRIIVDAKLNPPVDKPDRLTFCR